MNKKVTIELPEDLADYAQTKVASGQYGSLDEALTAGMRGLKDHDDMIDRWVKEEVMPTHERWKAGLEAEYTVEQVTQALRERRTARSSRKAS
jgi:antitoxin ParD1/3/4